jgi:hypothetical protein
MEKEFHVFFSGGLAEVHVGLLGQIILVEGGSNFDPFVGFLPPQRTAKIQPKLTRSFAVISFAETKFAKKKGWPKQTDRRLMRSNSTRRRNHAPQGTPNASFRGVLTVARQPHAQMTNPPPATGEPRAAQTQSRMQMYYVVVVVDRRRYEEAVPRGLLVVLPPTAAAATMVNGHGHSNRHRALVPILVRPRSRGGLLLHAGAAFAVSRLASAFLCYWLCFIVGVFLSLANIAL